MPNELKMYSFERRRGFLLLDRIMYLQLSVELSQVRGQSVLTAFSTKNM